MTLKQLRDEILYAYEHGATDETEVKVIMQSQSKGGRPRSAAWATAKQVSYMLEGYRPNWIVGLMCDVGKSAKGVNGDRIEYPFDLQTEV